MYLRHCCWILLILLLVGLLLWRVCSRSSNVVTLPTPTLTAFSTPTLAPATALTNPDLPSVNVQYNGQTIANTLQELQGVCTTLFQPKNL